jgi:hypothetical protein
MFPYVPGWKWVLERLVVAAPCQLASWGDRTRSIRARPYKVEPGPGGSQPRAEGEKPTRQQDGQLSTSFCLLALQSCSYSTIASAACWATSTDVTALSRFETSPPPRGDHPPQ